MEKHETGLAGEGDLVGSMGKELAVLWVLGECDWLSCMREGDGAKHGRDGRFLLANQKRRERKKRTRPTGHACGAESLPRLAICWAWLLAARVGLNLGYFRPKSKQENGLWALKQHNR